MFKVMFCPRNNVIGVFCPKISVHISVHLLGINSSSWTYYKHWNPLGFWLLGGIYTKAAPRYHPDSLGQLCFLQKLPFEALTPKFAGQILPVQKLPPRFTCIPRVQEQVWLKAWPERIISSEKHSNCPSKLMYSHFHNSVTSWWWQLCSSLGLYTDTAF